MSNNTLKKDKNQEKNILSVSKDKKMLQEVFFEHMKKLYEKSVISLSKLNLVNECGNMLKFITNEKRSVYSLVGGSFCKDRLCPICSWRNARKQAVILLELLEYIRKKYDKEFIFLTLTAPNVTSDKLNAEIDDYNKSFKRLSETIAFNKINLGYVRKLEITYNKKENTYHPHFHVIICVNKSYFKSRDYINKKTWLKMWQEAKRDNNITQVDVRKIEMNSIKDVFEIATYSTKQKDLLQNFEVFEILRNAFKSRRLITYNKIFRDVKKLRDAKLLELDDVTNLKDLVVQLDREIYYKWCNELKEYEEYQEYELSESDFKKIYDIDFSDIDVDDDVLIKKSVGSVETEKKEVNRLSLKERSIKRKGLKI